MSLGRQRPHHFPQRVNEPQWVPSLPLSVGTQVRVTLRVGIEERAPIEKLYYLRGGPSVLEASPGHGFPTVDVAGNFFGRHGTPFQDEPPRQFAYGSASCIGTHAPSCLQTHITFIDSTRHRIIDSWYCVPISFFVNSFKDM